MRICDDLRQAVLQAAIQGKLTKQLPEDGNAADLLKQITAEKAKLIKEGKIKKEKALQEISLDEIPFDIPDSWCWKRLLPLALTIVDCPHSTPRYYDRKTDFAAIDTNCIDAKGKIIGWRYVDEETYQNRIFRLEPVGNDIVYTREGSICRAAILPFGINICLGQRVMLIRCPHGILAKYIKMILMAPQTVELLTVKQKGIGAKHVNVSDVCNLVIPVPPTTEQHRIVALVEELMARIDDLEKTENELENLKAAFPADMKAALLQAAMQGKLTEQLPGESLDEITSHLVYDERIESPKEIPFDIPDNWQWIQIGNLGQSTDTNSFSDGPFGSNLKREHQINKSEVRIIQLSNIGETGWKNDNEKYTSFKHLEDVIPRCEVLPGDLVIAKMMPAGRTIEVPDLGTRITLGSDAMKFKPNNILNKRYLLYAMRSQAFLGQVYADAHGITRVRTTLKGIKSYVLPIPPLAEQKRIVEKLDKLLPLCDGLVEE